MTTTKNLAILFLAMGLAMAAGAVARAADTHPVKLPCTTVISGVDLLPGDYNIRWDLDGSRGTVKFWRNGRVVATVQGVVAKLDETATRNTLYFRKHPDGFMAITALALAGTDTDIVFPLPPVRRRQTSNPHMNSSAIDDMLSSPHVGHRMSGQ